MIHTSEGRESNPSMTYQQSYAGAISWFKNPGSGVSAHYCISPSGEITQLVELADKAYHATYYNSRSIGIEMGGFANDSGTWNPQNLAALENPSPTSLRNLATISRSFIQLETHVLIRVLSIRKLDW